MFSHRAARNFETRAAASSPLDSFDLARLLAEAADPAGDITRVPEYRHIEGLMQGRTDGRLAGGRLGDSGVSVPLGIFSRDATAGTGSAGGYTVGSPVVAHGNSLIGASVLDLVTALTLERGAPSVPIVETAPTAAWIATEGGSIPDDGGAFSSRTLTPTSLGMRFRYTTRLLRGGGRPFERLMRGEIERGIRRAVDKAILNGSGASGQPLGIAGTSGILTASGTALSFATIADLVRQVLATGARLADLTFVVDPQAFELLATREKAAGAGPIISEQQTIFGVPVLISEQAPAASLFLGPWRECILATWGSLDLLLDRRTAIYGSVQVTAFLDCAIAFRRPGSFVAISSIT